MMMSVHSRAILSTAFNAMCDAGVVLWELYSRKHPYPKGLENRKGWAVVEDAIKNGARPDIDDECPAGYAEVVNCHRFHNHHHHP